MLDNFEYGSLFGKQKEGQMLMYACGIFSHIFLYAFSTIGWLGTCAGILLRTTVQKR